MEHNFVLVPWYVKRALDKNKLTLATLLDYAKLRDVLALSDCAVIHRLNNGIDFRRGTYPYKVTESLNTSALLIRWVNSATQEFKSELSRTLNPLAHSSDTLNNITSSLKKETADPLEDENTYEIHCVDHNLSVIILNVGFDSVRTSDDAETSFIKSLIEHLYGLMPQHEANQSLLMKSFIGKIKEGNFLDLRKD